jgi:hypothetical protein
MRVQSMMTMEPLCSPAATSVSVELIATVSTLESNVNDPAILPVAAASGASTR